MKSQYSKYSPRAYTMIGGLLLGLLATGVGLSPALGDDCQMPPCTPTIDPGDPGLLPDPPAPDPTPPAPTPPSDPTPTPPSTPATEPSTTTTPTTTPTSVGEPYSPPTPAPKPQPPATQPIDVILTASIPEWQPATYDGPTTDYTVQRGDGLFRLAVRLGVPMDYLVSLNNLTPPYNLFVGQVLIVPEKGELSEMKFAALTQPSPPRP